MEYQSVNRIVVFIIVAFSLLMTTIDTTIVATALETLGRELDAPINWLGWTITAYSFGFVLMLPLSAKLSKRWGPRRLFLLSIGAFTMASLFCGLVNTITWLIPLRILQAVAAAGITPSVTALIVDHFGSARDRAVSLFGSIFPIGVMLGPIFGGLIVTYWSWRWIFFVNVPIGIVVIFAALHFIPKDKMRKSHENHKMDLPGMLWLAVGLIAGMLAATFLGQKEAGISPYAIVLLFAVGIGGILQFFRHINRVQHPFLAPLYISGKGFGAVNLINVIFSGNIIGVLSLVPLFAAHNYGISALDAGILLIAQGAASVISSTVMSILLRKTGYRLPLYVGCSIILMGTAVLALNPIYSIPPYYWLMGATAVIGTGMGIISPPARNAGLQLAPQESATIAALRSLCLQLGAIVNVAVATAIIASSSDPQGTYVWVYLAVALLFLVSLPLISRIPEHKGGW